MQSHIVQKDLLFQLQSFQFYAKKLKIFGRFPYSFRVRKNSFQNVKETRTRKPPLNVLSVEYKQRKHWNFSRG